jgi:hypothetical protein
MWTRRGRIKRHGILQVIDSLERGLRLSQPIAKGNGEACKMQGKANLIHGLLVHSLLVHSLLALNIESLRMKTI